MGLKCPKMFTHSKAKSTVKHSIFWHFRPIFGQNIDPKLPRSHFVPKRIHQKNISSKFQFSAKLMMAPPGGQKVTKIF